MNPTMQALKDLYPDILNLTTDDLNQAIDQAKDETEASFYLAIEGFLIGVKQKELIKKGVF